MNQFNLNTLEAHERRFWQKWGSYITVALLGFMAGSLATKTFWDSKQPKEALPVALKQTLEVKPAVVEAKEKDWSTDLVGYFRYRGLEIGYNDYDITKFHQVMDCENGLHTAHRVNYLYDGENGRYTAAGFAMITKSTFKWHKCEGDRFNGVDNINCFYKIIGRNELKDYKASRHCWGNKFNASSIKFINLEEKTK